MSTPDCIEAQRWIVADLDEGLARDEQDLLEAHLRDCESCRRMREETAEILSLLAEDVPPEPGEEFWREYDSSLEERIQRSDLRRRSVTRWKAVVTALAAGLAFVAIWVGYFDPLGHRTPINEAALPTVIEELDRVYGPMSGEGTAQQASGDTTPGTAEIPALRADTVAEWFATEYDPMMHWL